MTYREAFVEAIGALRNASVPTQSPELDARVLLAHAATTTHAGLLARWADPLSEGIHSVFREAIERRRVGEPVAWITGIKEFFGLEFVVPPGLLVPRADTEILVEAALEILTRSVANRTGNQTGPRVVDVCTGTGCVAVALTAQTPFPVEAWAGDLSPLAVETARTNAARLLPGRRLSVVESNLLAELPGPWDLVVSNPPYLTSRETEERVGAGGWREPPLALDGGDDGLNLIRTLVQQAAVQLSSGGWILLEAADAQMDAIAALYRAEGLEPKQIWKDLGGQRRVAAARKTSLASSIE